MTKFNHHDEYRQYLRILVAMRRAFFPDSRELALGTKKARIDKCVAEIGRLIPDSNGKEMLYMVAHLCYMQELYSGIEMRRFFRPDTLWRPSKFPGYLEETMVVNVNRAMDIIEIDSSRLEKGARDTFIIPLPNPEDFEREGLLVTTFTHGTKIRVPQTKENWLMAREYMKLPGAPQGAKLVLVLEHICRNTESQYVTYQSLIGNPARVFKALSEMKPAAPAAKKTIVDPDGFWKTYNRIKDKYGSVNEVFAHAELKNNQVARFLSDAKVAGAALVVETEK